MKEIALHILDIADNSLNAGAENILFSLVIDERGILHLIIDDDGRGMDETMLKKAQDPFFSTRANRKIGMGIPLLKQNAEMSGGRFEIHSEPGKGTRIEAEFNTEHIDCLPIGDLAGVMTIIFTSNPKKNIEFEYKNAEIQFFLNSFALQNVFGEENIQDAWVQKELKQFIHNNIKQLEV